MRKNPTAFVTQVWSWPVDNGTVSDVNIRAIDPEYPHRIAPAFLLFDNTEDSFWDEFFWSEFIKDIKGRNDSPYRALKSIMLPWEVLTAAQFHELFPQHEVAAKLRDAFSYSAPSRKDLEDPSISDLFLRLLQAGTVQGSDLAAIEICHYHGWIYVDDSGNYSLPSPLHAALLSCYLLPVSKDFSSIFELCIETISKFSPSQLQRPIRRIGDMHNLYHVVFEDEFKKVTVYNNLIECVAGPIALQEHQFVTF
ncbi:hypothetical protein H0H81_012643 [Sphagnurus paluster]|uniref:Uncharacterized protein n=1 Tax=Sphagnurus paluster TaxID=117069 RepID=A0A9P7FTU9_9AGAR|nr:hypothetical protein H0H81_012643 [Sphagnurus paluster]